MKILHIATRHIPGGASRNLEHWMGWELEHGHVVHLATGECGSTTLPPSVVRHELPSLRRDVNPVNDVRAVATLRRLVRRQRYDIVHTHQSKAGVVGRLAARALAGRIIHTVHMASFGEGYGRAASGAFLAAERFCGRFTDATVFVGEDLRRLYVHERAARPDSSFVIRSPVEIDRFVAVRSLSRDERDERRARFDLPRDRPVVVSIGALERRKRHDALIKGLRHRLAAEELCLAVAGHGDQDEPLRALVRKLGLDANVRFLGFVPDVENLLAGSDCLVHVAAVEGLPQVLVQAAAAGIPAISLPVHGASEVPGARVASDVGEAINDALTSVRAPIAPERLDVWRPDVIRRSIDAFYNGFVP